VPRVSFFSPFFFLRSSLLLLAAVFSSGIQAQLCTGSLGDPVVNITFGTGGGSGYPPPGGYTSTTSSCPDDGYYTITTSTSGCFGNTWHTVSSDHTGHGAFMLVNASFTPGDFFLTSVTDLCPNTTYEFAAWIMNVLNRGGIMPNITFRIETPDGTILKEFQTGDIPATGTPVWVQYGFYFTTPADNARIVLRMTNNAPGGLGNDLALDDITFRPCGPLISASIQGNAGDTVNVCEGNTNMYTFNASVSSAYVSPVYQWQLSKDKGQTWNDIPGATSLTYQRQPTGAGDYWYRLAVVEASAANFTSCRIASNGVVINVHAKPLVDAGPDRILITGNSVTLMAAITGDDAVYSWTPDNFMNDVHALTPTVSPPFDMNYKLSAVSAYGCAGDDNVLVKVVTGIYVPNAFTPNNDGKNDTWTIPFLDPAFDASVSVFNRYGQLVYHSVGEVVSWDGTLDGVPQASGAYVYLVTFKGSKLILKGQLLLIR
jgi:gliding motility-associated-like protein